MPSESYLPVVMTLCISIFFAGLVSQLWWLAAIGAVSGVGVGIVWLWPLTQAGQREVPADV